ncbi:MAG: hypothetical protein ACKVQA_26500, partial [Burkholderiales bacterium]
MSPRPASLPARHHRLVLTWGAGPLEAHAARLAAIHAALTGRDPAFRTLLSDGAAAKPCRAAAQFEAALRHGALPSSATPRASGTTHVARFS